MADTDPKALDALARLFERRQIDCDPEGNALHSTCDHDDQAEGFVRDLAAEGLSLVPTATLDALRGKLDLSEGVAMEFARQVDEQKQKVRTREAGWGENGCPLPFVNAERKQEMYEELVASGLSRPEAMANVWPALASLPAEQPATPETERTDA